MPEMTKKTIPIVDVWMFLWRLLFTPLVIAGSFILSIVACCLMLFTFILVEFVGFLVNFVASLCGRRWVIKERARSIYDFFRQPGEGWSDEEYLVVPTEWWRAVTDPPVRKTLSHAANWLSLLIYGIAGTATLMVWITRSFSFPTALVVVMLWLGLILWGGLWLVKNSLEFLMRWIFQRPRPKPQS